MLILSRTVKTILNLLREGRYIHADLYTVESPKNTRSLLRIFGPYRSIHSEGIIYEPPHGKTNNLHRRKQRRRSASR